MHLILLYKLNWCKMYKSEDIRKVAVYCASSSRLRPVFYEAAAALGKSLAEQDLELIYGAGYMGLMGAVADAVLAKGGKVTGVIPQFMVEQGWHNERCTELVVTGDMAARKTWIWQHADALVALPGGIGTLDELTEIMTLKQLGIVTQPIVILNTEGYYDHLLAMFDHMVTEQFWLQEHKQMYTVVNLPEEIIPAIFSSECWTKDSLKKAKF